MAPVLLSVPAVAVLVLGCVCAVPLQGQKHMAHVDPLTAHRSSPQCWDSSSALLLEMRSPRIADTVPAFWDLMLFLRSSDNSKHTALFWDLARVFWDLYLDCVLSKSHGLGRRHITAVHSLITDKHKMDFRKLLLEAGKSLRSDEVKALTFLCADLLGQTLASVESASDLFCLLVDRDYLSAEQPQLLAELLIIIQRRRLLRDLKLTVPTNKNLISPYRKLLYNLSEGLTVRDLKDLKFLLKSELPRRKLEDHVTTLEVFLEMEHMDLISDSDLDLLESTIQQLCPMLKEKIVQFRAEHAPGFVAQETSPPKSHSSDPNQLPKSHEGGFPHEAAELGSLTEPSLESCNISGDLPNSRQGGDVCEALSHGLSGLSTEAGSCVPSTERNDASLVSNHFLEEEAATGMQASQNTNTSTEELQTYPMTAAKRGICLIINNYDFSKSKKYSTREGTLMDEDRLCKVFNWLGFDTETKRDCESDTMLSVMQELSSIDHSQMDCLVCCILSHGLEGSVCGVDGNTVEIRKLMEPFNGLKCPSLAEKPKLFFIQACQGTDKQFPVYTEADGPTGSPVCSDSIPFKESIPSDSDFLLGMATVPSFASFRERSYGSWFIQSLCQNLIQLVPSGCDLVSILTKVNADVSQKTALTKEGLRKQIPQPAFTLTKKVIFPKPRAPPPCL